MVCIIAGSWVGWLLAFEPSVAVAFNSFLALQWGPNKSALGESSTYHLHYIPYFPSCFSISYLEENGKSAGNSFPPPRLWPAVCKPRRHAKSEVLYRRDLTQCCWISIWKIILEDCRKTPEGWHTKKDKASVLNWILSDSEIPRLDTMIKLSVHRMKAVNQP